MNRDVCKHFVPTDLPCDKCESVSVQKNTLREAAQQALEALEDMLGWQSLAPQTIQESAKGRAAALRAALAEPVQEPVAWMHTDPEMPLVQYLEWRNDAPGYRGRWIKTPLYTAPPQRLPLTDETLWEMWIESPSDVLRFARAIERVHGIGEKPDAA